MDLNTIIKGSFDQAEAIRAMASAIVTLARQVKDLEARVDASLSAGTNVQTFKRSNVQTDKEK